MSSRAKFRTAERARTIRCGVVVIAMLGLAAAQSTSIPPADAQGIPTQSRDVAQNQDAANQDANAGLVIEPDQLPPTYPRAPYHVKFHARGNYVPVLHWRLQKGALPPGITLADDGTLQGEAQRAGEFQFVIAVTDGGQPAQALQRGYVIEVTEAISVAWKVPPRVNVNRIDGSVEVSNTTPEEMDLTFDVKAVAENGRATEIGYQHFPLKGGTTGMVLPFGDTLPNGGYLVSVTVVGEVAKRNAIYRQLLQTPRPLHVTVGP